MTPNRATTLSGAEKFWYYFINIVSLGGLYFVKIAVKKAFAERAAEEIIRRSEMRGEMRMPREADTVARYMERPAEAAPLL